MGIVNYKEHTTISDCCERLASSFYQGRIGRRLGEVKIVGGESDPISLDTELA